LDVDAAVRRQVYAVGSVQALAEESIMWIGQLAAKGGTIVETVRYYERLGLLPDPERSPSGYRQYRQDDLQRLAFIRRSRTLGFSLGEIRSLLTLAADPAQPCAEITALARAHLAEVRRKLEELRALEGQLARLANCCQGVRVAECRILDQLRSPGTGSPPVCSSSDLTL